MNLPPDASPVHQVDLLKAEYSSQSRQLVFGWFAGGRPQAKQSKPCIGLYQWPRHTFVQAIEGIQQHDNIGLLGIKVCCRCRSATNDSWEIRIIDYSLR